jgi:hypothetical protein
MVISSSLLKIYKPIKQKSQEQRVLRPPERWQSFFLFDYFACLGHFTVYIAYCVPIRFANLSRGGASSRMSFR